MKSMTKIIYNYLSPDGMGGKDRVQFWVLGFLLWMWGQLLGLVVQGADAVVVSK